MTKDQISGIADRAALMMATWLAARGYIPQGMVADIVQLLVAIGGVAWGFYVNRPTAIVQSAAALPQTTVITAPSLANSTPETNIQSNADVKVVQR